MKRRDRLQALAGQSAAQLLAESERLRRELDTARIEAAFGRAKNPHALTGLRHDLARVLTRLSTLTRGETTPSNRSGSAPSNEETK